jgi:hypothetical protein
MIMKTTVDPLLDGFVELRYPLVVAALDEGLRGIEVRQKPSKRRGRSPA